jgi:hypothetical protein
MPCYTEKELLSIGEYLRVEKRIAEGMQGEYSEASIKQSFYQSGGISHIFPQSMGDMETQIVLQVLAAQGLCCEPFISR